MKKIILIGFICFVFLTVYGKAEQIRPIAVSPGSENDALVVSQSCPTFSWSAVPWSEAYKVAVFPAMGDQVIAYEEMELLASPIIIKEIRGPALSWTPSEGERLVNKETYVWYVQAVNTSGSGVWSEGRIFQVEELIRFAAVEERLRENLKEYGMNEDDIERVITNSTSEFQAVKEKNISEISSGYMGRDQGEEGDTNTYYGLAAGRRSKGKNNSFFGRRAGIRTAGNDNTFLGYFAGRFNTIGGGNSFTGSYAGYSNTTGLANTFIGSHAGHRNTSGQYNTFSGYYAGRSNTTGYSNTFIGEASGHQNTSGGANTFLGSWSGFEHTTGNYNTLVGTHAGGKNTTGYGNTIIGYDTGRNNVTGNINVFLGQYAGYYETGSNKLYIDNSKSSTPLIYGEFDTDKVVINRYLGVGVTPTHRIDVSGGAYCDGSNWYSTSNRDYKENIQNLDIKEAMEALEKLDPVKFNYKENKEEEYVGFIAEDVPDLVATKDRKGMIAMEVVAVLTKVVQEQQKRDDILTQIVQKQQLTLQDQQKTIDDLCKQIDDLKKRK